MSKWFENETIAALAEKQNWTFSERNTKRPIDLFELLSKGRLRGVSNYSQNPCRTLKELMLFFPGAKGNFAYRLNGKVDKLCVLDIESSCPEDVKQEFIDTLPYLYGEISMSGKGVHLVFPLPEDILEKYPDAYNKIVLKSKDKTFEILIKHWVTFTGYQLNNPVNTNCDENAFRELFEKLASEQVSFVRKNINASDMRPDLETTYSRMNGRLTYKKFKEKRVEQYVKNLVNPECKTPPCSYKALNDLNGDKSAYEYRIFATIYQAIIAKIDEINGYMKAHKKVFQEIPYLYPTEEELVWTTYEIALVFLDLPEDLTPFKDFVPREKHEQARNGLPWLLYLAQEVVAKSSRQYTYFERKAN